MVKRILVRIQWRTLFYCGIGLWIALCASDLYYSEYNELMLSADKVLPTTIITNQGAVETDTATSISHFIEKSHETWSTTRKSRILTTFIVLFVSIWSVLCIVWIQEFTRRKSGKFIYAGYLKQEPNSNKVTCKSTGIQVSYSYHFISTLYSEKDEKRSSHEWYSSMESSEDTASYNFKEKKNEHGFIYSILDNYEKEINNNNNKEYNKHKIKHFYNRFYTYHYELISPLIPYIYLSRSIHFQSTLLSQRYTISIFNTFGSLPIKYFFDSNNKEEIIVNKLKILHRFNRKNEELPKSEYLSKTNGYIISSSPAFQQFLANFMNIKCMQ